MPASPRTLTTDIQKALKRKRLSLGLSYAALGQLLLVSRATAYAWENTPAPRCTVEAWGRLRAFIVQSPDQPLHLMKRLGRQGQTLRSDQIEGRAAALLELAGKLRSLPDLQEDYHSSLKNAYKDMLASYAASL